MMQLTNKHILVAGGGISGQGAMTALEIAGARAELSEGAALCMPLKPGQYDEIVVSPGIPATHPLFAYAAAADIPVIAELELGYRLNDAQVVAVTGTNGKTTTVGLLHEILGRSRRAALCGNVGASFAAAAANGGYDTAVVEVSSFQLEHTADFRPHIAVITNITPDHLDRHKTPEVYAALKRKIAARQGAEDILILSADDIPLEALDGFCPPGRVCYFSTAGRVNGAYALDGTVYLFDTPLCETGRLRLQGVHNLKNALAAALAAHLLGAPDEDIVEAFSTVTADAHRMEYVAAIRGVAFYNDSKATNIAAALAGISTLSGTIALIAGGSGKGYTFDALFEGLPKAVKHIAATGETAPDILRAARHAGFSNIAVYNGMDAAVEAMYRTGCENVLLSPAAASFDRYQNYTVRGRDFVRAVEGLKHRETKESR